MLIQSHDRFSEIADFDPATGTLVVKRRDEPEVQAALAQPLRGHFADLAGTLAVFYRWDEALWLRLGAAVGRLGEGSAAVEWSRTAAKAKLLLRVGDRVTASEYEPGPREGPPLDEDPTPFVEREHWDFGEFVHNVVGDAGRASRIYRDAIER